jgi:hypothetical protein
MKKLIQTTCLILSMLTAFYAHAQEEFSSPEWNGNGTQRLKGSHDQSWNAATLQWDLEDSVAIVYNAQLQIVQETMRKYNASNATWDLHQIRKKQYTANGSDYIIVDSFPSSIYSSRKYIFTYNSNEQRTLTEEYRLVGGVWTQAFRTQYSYTVSNKINTELKEIYSNNTWKNYERYVHVYNGSDQEVSNTNEEWISNAWVGSGRATNTYNASGFLQTKKEETFNSTTNLYENFSENTFTYDASGQVLSQAVKNWDLPTSAWKNTYKYSYTYNAQQRRNTQIVQVWSNGSWINSGYSSYNYNVSNWCIGVDGRSWNSNTNQWDSVSKSVFTYNANGYITKYLFQNFNTSLNAWVSMFEKYFWYGPGIPLSVNEMEEVKNFIVYPNPVTSNSFTIRTEKEGNYSISDLQGRTLVRGQLKKGANSIYLTPVSTGTYILQAHGVTQFIQKN